MRMMFGLVGLLVTIGVLIMIFHYIEAPVIKQSGQTKKKVEAWASANTPDGMEEAKASIVLDEVTSGGHFNGFLVRSVTPGGLMAREFGLAPGDTIVAIAGLRVRDDNNPDLSREQLFEAKLRGQPLTVIRGGIEIELRAP